MTQVYEEDDQNSIIENVCLIEYLRIIKEKQKVV